MSVYKSESLHFYEYLCRKIGSEQEIKIRRFTFIAIDTSSPDQVSSGSKSEGLNLKGSDIDLMFVNPTYKVYEDETEIVQSRKIGLLMDTTDTQPCYTRLRLYTDYNRLHKDNRKVLVRHGMKYLMSNKLYKETKRVDAEGFINKIHGPCFSDDNNNYDLASCLKCDKWVSQAVPWINRPRSSWLSPEIIHKIIMRGVLFVAIGFKDSINEDLEWRISFSVAERVLIFGFNHTQLLCFALLKIVLKEIIERDEGLKGLLCSYYIKTLLFWILDDTNPTVWKPDNIIPCFRACLQRLLYCVEYSTLLHYFISDLNLFGLRLSTVVEKNETLTVLLANLYDQDIQCFSASETLCDYSRFSTTCTTQLNIMPRLVHDVLEICRFCPVFLGRIVISACLNRLLLHCKPDLSAIFQYYLSKGHQCVPEVPRTQHQHGNKQQYVKYKHDLSHLLIGVHSDSVVGWVMLASFFYVNGKYLTSLRLINYALSKVTDEKCEHYFKPDVMKMNGIIMTPKQESAIDTMKNEKLITILKSLTISRLQFQFKSQIIPKELQDEVKTSLVEFPLLTFAHFLKFLCLFHLREHISYIDALKQLFRANAKLFSKKKVSYNVCLHSVLFIGIAKQMLCETKQAKLCFEFAAEVDKFGLTTAKKRLLELSFDF